MTSWPMLAWPPLSIFTSTSYFLSPSSKMYASYSQFWLLNSFYDNLDLSKGNSFKSALAFWNFKVTRCNSQDAKYRSVSYRASTHPAICRSLTLSVPVRDFRRNIQVMSLEYYFVVSFRNCHTLIFPGVKTPLYFSICWWIAKGTIKRIQGLGSPNQPHVLAEVGDSN